MILELGKIVEETKANHIVAPQVDPLTGVGFRAS
jgi:hypothetical protein